MSLQKEKLQKQITKTWISGQTSCTLVIPKIMADEYGLNKPSHVIVEPRSDGILIKKLQF